MCNKGNKNGLSLVEALVSLLLIGVIISMSMPMITKKKNNLTSSTTSYLSAYQAIQKCNSGTASSCAVGYNSNWNQSCSQVITAWPSATTQSYNLSTSSAGAYTATSCTMTSVASAAISGCDAGNTVDCAYAYNNNLNQTCGQIASSWPAAVASTGTAHYLSTSSAGARTGSTTTCYPTPPDPDCGAANITTGTQTLRVSLCNNSAPGTETTANNGNNNSNCTTAGCVTVNNCWLAAPTAGTNCSGTGCNASRILCNQGGAQDACNALNPSSVPGTATNSLWRLPTSAELGKWETTYEGNSAILPNVRASLDLCDDNSSYKPYCTIYSGCTGDANNNCGPRYYWVADSTYYYSLYGGLWYGPSSGGGTNFAFSVRCVRNL